jgi:hypothetical protein
VIVARPPEDARWPLERSLQMGWGIMAGRTHEAAPEALPAESRRVLEARFHPFRKGDKRYLVAGWVLFYGEQASVLPAPAVGENQATEDRTALIQKFRYLVEAAGTAPLTNLKRLRSTFWSFVDVSDRLLSDQFGRL